MIVILLLIIVVVIIGAIVLTGLAGFMGFGLFAFGAHMQKKAEARAPEILDEAFDGRDDVVFKINLESLKYETVIIGAKDRGYALYSETNDTDGGSAKTLIFEKVKTPTDGAGS